MILSCLTGGTFTHGFGELSAALSGVLALLFALRLGLLNVLFDFFSLKDASILNKHPLVWNHKHLHKTPKHSGKPLFCATLLRTAVIDYFRTV